MAGLASEYVAAVDSFLAAQKTLVGAGLPLTWASGRDPGALTVKLPIELNGEQQGQSLLISTFPDAPSTRFHIGIIWGTAVCRLDYQLEDIHGNNVRDAAEGLPAIVEGPHYHCWALNRRFVTSTREHLKLQNALPLASNIRQFDAALRWFCADNNIDLPPRHTISLPPRTRLFT